MSAVRSLRAIRTAPVGRFLHNRTSPFHSFSSKCTSQQIAFPSRQRILTHNLKSQPFDTFRSLRTRSTRFSSTNARPTPDPTPNLGSPNQTLSQRLKALSKEYGWAALGVYLGLSVLDFPFCYLAVQLLGPERVGKAEHAIIDGIRSMVRAVFPDLMQSQEEAEASRHEAAESEKGNKATVWTQLVLAYAVHKSLIFFRVPLTAAVLPQVVKTLRSYGWNVGKASSKSIPSGAIAAQKS